ncbi:hypothetical protein EZS27_010606 [termite gut metagenome]|uniref:Uncharacterized protein n=1 Tax=termite gut metagenome TaxID=433724 RepID=A0A5J4S8F9_9ZZZZ
MSSKAIENHNQSFLLPLTVYLIDTSDVDTHTFWLLVHHL